MRSRISGLFRRIASAAAALNPRERIIVGAAAIGVVLFTLSIPVTNLNRYLSDSRRLVAARSGDLKQLERLVERYRSLSTRLANLEQTLEKSQLSISQVTSKLSTVVREAIGGDRYNLIKRGSPTKLGLSYEKQNFTLKIDSASLEQLIKLLYRLEKEESSLFLGKVELHQSPKGEMSATMEISSIRKVQ